MENKKITGSVLIHPDELDHTWILEAKRLGIPRIGLHPEGGTQAHLSMAGLLEMLKTPEFRAILDDAHDNGIEIEYEMHAARYLLPADEFAAHPDWFRMNENGERTPDKNCCCTNEEAMAYMGRRAAEVASQLYRSTHRYFLWMDDAMDAMCHCPGCREFAPSEQQTLMMNALLTGIRTVDPEAELAFLAYAECREIPVKVKPMDGIFLEFAPMDRDFPIAINDPASPRNARQCDSLPPLLEFFGVEKAKLLEYWLDNSMYSGWKKPPKAFTPNPPIIAADGAYYKSMGFRDLSTFACFLGYDYRPLHGMPDVTPFADLLKE